MYLSNYLWIFEKYRIPVLDRPITLSNKEITIVAKHWCNFIKVFDIKLVRKVANNCGFWLLQYITWSVIFL